MPRHRSAESWAEEMAGALVVERKTFETKMSRRNRPSFYLDLVKPICHVIGMIVGLIAMFAWLPAFLQYPVGFKPDSGPPWYVAVVGLVIFAVSLSMLYDEEYEPRQKK